MTTDRTLALTAGVMLLVFGGFVSWRASDSGHSSRPAHMVEVRDASTSMQNDCGMDVQIITRAIASMTVGNRSSLTIIRTGDTSSNLEPQLVFEEAIPVAPNGPLASHAKAKAKMEAFLARAKAACEAIPQTQTSPIIKAVRRGLAHLKSLGCVQGTGCLLVLHSDLQDNDEFGRGTKFAKAAAPLDNSSIRVVLCGFTQTREDGGVTTDTLIGAWTKVFTEPVTVAPFCEGGGF